MLSGGAMSDLSSYAYLAFAAGLLSVLSPCVLPLMPAYLSLISGISVEEMQEGSSDAVVRRRVLGACMGFITGFSTIFIMMGVGAVAIGRTLRTWEFEIAGIEFGIGQIAGLIIILFGLHMTGLLPVRALYRDTRFHREMSRFSFVSTFVVGAGFAFGWSPCVGPILGGILTIAGGRETVYEGMLLLGVYSLGLGVPFFLAGWSIEYFFRALQRMRRHFRTVEIVAGVLLIGVGLLVLTNRLTALNDYFLFMNEIVEAAEQRLL